MRSPETSCQSAIEFHPCSLGSTTKATTSGSGPRITFCFNPCSLGSTTKAQVSAYSGEPFISFQSLFSWINHKGPGQCVFRRAIHIVSILVLLDQPQRQADPAVEVILPDIVSILVLLDQPQRLYPCHNASFRLEKSFNPCSLGSTTKAVMTEKIYARVNFVSILVLLDQPQRQGAHLGVPRIPIPVSILVLLDQPQRL